MGRWAGSQYHVSSTTYTLCFFYVLYIIAAFQRCESRGGIIVSALVYWSFPPILVYQPLLRLHPWFTFLPTFTFYYFYYIYFLDTIILEIVCQWLSTSRNNWWAYIVSFEHGGTWSLLLGLPVQTCLDLAWGIFVNGRNSVQVEDWWQSVVDDFWSWFVGLPVRILLFRPSSSIRFVYVSYRPVSMSHMGKCFFWLYIYIYIYSYIFIWIESRE